MFVDEHDRSPVRDGEFGDVDEVCKISSNDIWK